MNRDRKANPHEDVVMPAPMVEYAPAYIPVNQAVSQAQEAVFTAIVSICVENMGPASLVQAIQREMGRDLEPDEVTVLDTTIRRLLMDLGVREDKAR